MKDHLSDRYALIILLGAALGSGFLSLPYSLQKFPIGSKYKNIRMLFNFSFTDASFQLLFWYDFVLLLGPYGENDKTRVFSRACLLFRRWKGGYTLHYTSSDNGVLGDADFIYVQFGCHDR